MNITTPTPVQEKAIPVILEGKDLIACAQTGTGKTAAFVLPIIDKLANRENHNKATTLILVPTRELAIQIDQQIMGFSYCTPATSVAVYGGNDSMLWETQKTALINGADIIIATPGRLITHLNFDYFKLSDIEHFILDEADRMLDMGFVDDITAIAAKLPAKRQTVMFSATMPDKIRKLARKILHNPVEINLATSKPAENVLQAVCMAEDPEKVKILISLLKDKPNIKSVVIFSSTKTKVKEIEKTLRAAKLNTASIHSDLEQKEREEVMRRFRSRDIQLLGEQASTGQQAPVATARYAAQRDAGGRIRVLQRQHRLLTILGHLHQSHPIEITRLPLHAELVALLLKCRSHRRLAAAGRSQRDGLGKQHLASSCDRQSREIAERDLQLEVLSLWPWRLLRRRHQLNIHPTLLPIGACHCGNQGRAGQGAHRTRQRQYPLQLDGSIRKQGATDEETLFARFGHARSALAGRKWRRRIER